MKNYLILSLLPIAIVCACSGAEPTPIPWGEVKTVPTPTDAGKAVDSAVVDSGTDTSVSCVPESDSTMCRRYASACGAVIANDNCGTPRTVLSCGSCQGNMACNNGVCTDLPCVPAKDKVLCATANKDCGVVTLSDNCGVIRDAVCGPSVCGKGFACLANKCTACVPKTCLELAFTCGQASDGCNPAPLDCGVCINGNVCSNDNGGVCQCTGPTRHFCPAVPNVCVANDDKACGPDCTNCKPDLPGVTPACTNNACDYSNCSPGYVKCPNQPPGPGALGCQNLQNDPINCGVCNKTCLPGKACVAGVCAP